ncbi:MAG: divalent-cation tolerance protein CutA [Deltaproteobacteria bacterium]|jgi:periplasmic divalent cation tolerance protein|nr:divalent-cation tolerance protein CutA [Deltaproteobacteria bacterium]
MTKGTAYNLVKGRVIYAVFPDAEMAETVARSAVEKRLAACANIFPAHLSVYRWKNSIESANEIAVIFKSIEQTSAALIEHIQSNHSYETPAIIEFSITNSTPAFANWLNESCLP